MSDISKTHPSSLVPQHYQMSESANLPMNFGGIAEEEFSSFENSQVLILPVSYEGTVSFGVGTGAGAMAIVDASRNMELYDEETDAEVYKIGIHTLKEFPPQETPEAMMNDLPTKIFWAKDIVRRTDWIDDAIDSLTENVYLTIDIDGLDPSLVPTTGTPEPGGLGWYEVLTLLRKLAEKRRVIGMDLVEFSKTENSDAPAFLCAKLIYKSLAYIFKNDTPKVIGRI